MKSKTTVTMFMGLILLATSAMAQPIDAYASGFQHIPLGGVSSLTVDGRRLSACCLGSSGKDGVEVLFNSLWGGGVGVELTPLVSPTGAVTQIQCVSKGWDGTVKGRLTIDGFGDGSIMSYVDFSDIGAIGVRTITYGTNGQVISDEITPGPIEQYPDVPVCPPPGSPTWWQTGGGWWVWGCGYGLDPHGNPYPYTARTVAPVLPPGVPVLGELASIEVTGTDVGELNLINANIGTFGVSSWGLGEAHISEQCDNPAGCTPEEVALRADNLGSSGQDGVSIDLGENVGGTALYKDKCCRGHVIIMKAFDDEGQEAARMQSWTDPDPNVPGETLDVDFSGMGATAIDVEFFDDNGGSVGRWVVGDGSFGGWMSDHCLPGCAAVYEQNWNTGWWSFVRCDCSGSYDFVANTGEVVNGVHSIAFRPLGAGTPMVRHVEFTTDDPSGALVIREITVDHACRGDLSGDGNVNLADLATLLAHYPTASGAVPADGDMDGDGDIDLSDLAAMLAAYGSTCN